MGFEWGQMLYAPGYSAPLIFLLLEGRVRVYKMVAERELTLVVLKAGTMFGEMSFTAGRSQGAYAQALERSRVCMMSHDQLKGLIAKNPEVGLKVAEVLSERQALYGDRMADIGFKGVTARLAGLILQLVKSEGVVTPEGYRISTRYTQEQLGTMIAAQRVAVTRALGELQKAGAVKLDRRQIYVKELEALERAAKR